MRQPPHTGLEPQPGGTFTGAWQGDSIRTTDVPDLHGGPILQACPAATRAVAQRRQQNPKWVVCMFSPADVRMNVCDSERLPGREAVIRVAHRARVIVKALWEGEHHALLLQVRLKDNARRAKPGVWPMVARAADLELQLAVLTTVYHRLQAFHDLRLPGQRPLPAVVPAGERLVPRHGSPPGDLVGPPPGPPDLAGPPQRSRARGGAHPYSHTEGRPLLYDDEAALVQRCLSAAVTAAQDEPCLAPSLGPAEQHAYGSMFTAAVDKVFEHLDAAHDALARTVGRRQPSLTGSDPARGDPPESGKRLQAAILRYDILAACVPAAYQANASRHCTHSEAALRLAEELRVHRPDFAKPHRASYRRSWGSKQPPSRSAHSWRPTARARSQTSGAATSRPCEGQSRWRFSARQASETCGSATPERSSHRPTT